MSWDVPNPKGRIASILSTITWTLLILLLAIRGDWSIYTVLLMVLFILLLILSLVRVYQEWREGGEWLE
jgi:hypothetical protein